MAIMPPGSSGRASYLSTRLPPPNVRRSNNVSADLVSFLTSRISVAVASILLTLFVHSLLSTGGGRASSTDAGASVQSFDLTKTKATRKGSLANEKLLVLTPLKDAEPYLDEYFDNLARLDYPKHLVSLAFLVSDSSDKTLSKLERIAKQRQQTKGDRYDSIQIYRKDFNFNLANEVRHGFEGQPVRRAFIARARNYLITAALKPDHAWVLWLDVDVVRYDPHILMDLINIDKDIVVPNTLWHQPKSWDFWGFDRNNFAETERSLELLKKLGPDTLLVEGYRELVTERLHLVDMPTHLGLAYVPLDGIGCTFALVKARVHREGVMFPTFVFDNEIETEGFAKMAKKAGFQVVGVPGVVVFHAMNL